MTVNIARADMGLCVVCGEPKRRNALTCAREDCHEAFVAWCEGEYGFYRKVVDETTGKTHRVSTRDIIERGIVMSELKKYPEWALQKGENVK